MIVPPKIMYDQTGDVFAAQAQTRDALRLLDGLQNRMELGGLTEAFSETPDMVTGRMIKCHAYKTPFGFYTSEIGIYMPLREVEVVEEEIIEVEEGIPINTIHLTLTRSDGLVLDDELLANVTIWLYNSRKELLKTSVIGDRKIGYDEDHWTVNLFEYEMDEDGYYLAYTCKEGIKTEYPAQKAPGEEPQFIGSIVQAGKAYEDTIQHWVLWFQPTHPESWWSGRSAYQIFDSNGDYVCATNGAGTVKIVLSSQFNTVGDPYDLNGFSIKYVQYRFGSIDVYGGRGVWARYPGGIYKEADLEEAPVLVKPTDSVLTGVLRYYWRMAHSKEPNATSYNSIEQTDSGYWQDYPPTPVADIMYGVKPYTLYPQKYAYNKYDGRYGIIGLNPDYDEETDPLEQKYLYEFNSDYGFRYDIKKYPNLSVWSYERWSANVDLKVHHTFYIPEGATYQVTVRHNNTTPAGTIHAGRGFVDGGVLEPYYSNGLVTRNSSEEPVGSTYTTTVNPDGQITLRASRAITPPPLGTWDVEDQELVWSELCFINNVLTTGVSMSVDYD